MNTNRHLLAKLTKAFDQAAVAKGGYYKAQPTPPPRTYADMPTSELTLALAQLMERLGTLPEAHAMVVWGEAAQMQAILASRAQGGAV